MKERLKTVLLLFLVSISIIFTQKLWIDIPTQVFTVFGNKAEDSSSYVLSDMITPNKYLLNFNNKTHTLVYDDSKYGMWQSAKESLVKVFSSRNINIEEISREEYSRYKKNKSIIFYFSEDMNTYILTKAWDIEKLNSIVDSMPIIDSIYVYLGNGDPFFVFNNNEEHLLVRNENIDVEILREQINNIEKEKNYVYYYSMKDTLGTPNDIFIPYEINNTLPEVYVANEISSLDYSEKVNLVERFFDKNIDYIREIVESNGSSIYIYDQSVLKLNINGTIEYFQPLEERVKERNFYQSLSAASNFISEKTDLQKGIYLAKIKEIEADGNLGYRLSFRYRIRGIPVILGNQEIGEYVEIDVFNNHIRNYKYYARKDMNKIPNKVIENRDMMSAFDVIDKNYLLLEEWYLNDNDINNENQNLSLVDEVLASIEDVNLAYFDPCLKDQDEKLIVVWVIKFNERLLAFDVYNGMLVYER